MKKHDEQFYNDPWDRDFYETGSTRPPKNRGGLIAVLLIMVILLSGISTALGLMNIRLFHQLEDAGNPLQNVQGNNQADSPQIDASVSNRPAPTVEQEDTGAEERSVRLGLECVTVSAFDRRYYRLPSGCLVMGVDESGCAAKAGVSSGDVIVSLDSKTVSDVEQLIQRLEQYHAGDIVELTVYRSSIEKHITLTVTLDEA